MRPSEVAVGQVWLLVDAEDIPELVGEFVTVCDTPELPPGAWWLTPKDTEVSALVHSSGRHVAIDRRYLVDHGVCASEVNVG